MNNECPQCNGTGKEELFNCVCRRCKGAASTEEVKIAKSETKPCPQCNGTGYEEITSSVCRRCNGTKTVKEVEKSASFMNQVLVKTSQNIQSDPKNAEVPPQENQLENPFAMFYDETGKEQNAGQFDFKRRDREEDGLDEAVLMSNDMSEGELKLGIVSMSRMINEQDIEKVFKQVCGMLGENPEAILAANNSMQSFLYSAINQINLSQLKSIFCLVKRFV